MAEAKEQLYIVTVACAGGPAVSDAPRTAKQILGKHPSLKRFSADEMAEQCVLAGQWQPHEEAYDATPSSDARISALEREIAELRQKTPPSNRMKSAADNR